MLKTKWKWPGIEFESSSDLLLFVFVPHLLDLFLAPYCYLRFLFVSASKVIRGCFVLFNFYLRFDWEFFEINRKLFFVVFLN